MNITVSIDLDEYSEGTLSERIVSEAADKVAASIKANVISQLQKEIEKRAVEQANKAVEQAIKDALAEGVIRSNSYGYADESKRVPFKQIIIERVDKLMHSRVNSDGRPSDYSNDQFFVDYVISRIARQQLDQVKSAVTKEINERLDEEVRQRLTDAVATSVLQAMKK